MMKLLKAIFFLIHPLVFMSLHAENNEAFYMQRLLARDADNEMKLQCIDSLLHMGAEHEDSLKFLKLDLAVETGKYNIAIDVYKDLRKTNQKYSIDDECKLRFKYICALNTAKQFYDCMYECLALSDLSKPDSLIYYDAYVNEMLDEFIRKSKIKSDRDYIAETSRILEYAKNKNLPSAVVERIAKTLHNQKMLDAIYSADYDTALREITELMKLPTNEFEQAQLDTNLAYIYMMINEPALAEKYFIQLLESPNLYYSMGVALMNYMHLLNEQGRYQESIDVFNKYPKAAQLFGNDLYYTYLMGNKAVAEYKLGLKDEGFANMIEIKEMTDSLYLQSKANNSLLAHQVYEKDAAMSKMSPRFRQLNYLAWIFGSALFVVLMLLVGVYSKWRKANIKFKETTQKLENVSALYDECKKNNEEKLQVDNGKIAANLLQLGIIEESFSLIDATLSNRRKTIDEKFGIISDIIGKAKKNMTVKDLFEQQFEQAHAPFFKNLYAAHPDLTPSEARMCAYIIMNLTNKEIAAISNKTQRAVESIRYRICKKFNLPEGQSAVTYLRQFI